MEDAMRDLWEWDVDGPAQKLRPFAQWVQRCKDAVENFFRGLSDRQIVMLIILINLLIVIVYLLTHITRRRWKKGLLLSVFMLAMPVVGPLYLLMAEILQLIQKLFGDRLVSTQELSFDQTRIREIPDTDVEKELNIVPVEEALIISDHQDKRERLLETLKDGQAESLSTIRSAVDNEDPEVAHYAATFLADQLARVKEKERLARENFEQEQTPESCDAYILVLLDMLRMKVFDGSERRRYLTQLESCLLWQLEHAPQSCSVANMAELAKLFINADDMAAAKRWIDRLETKCYENLDAFKACAMYYYRSGDRLALLKLLDGADDSGLILDSETLEWIRFFDRSSQALG